MATIALSIDPKVVPDWGLWEAVREIMQGAIDAKVGYFAEYSKVSQSLTITNPGQLTKASLRTGHSSKRGDSTQIGQHGEGYKLAAAVLLRLNKAFSIYNYNEVWTFSVRYNRSFKANTLYLETQRWFTKEPIGYHGNIVWEIKGIKPEEYALISENIYRGGDIETPSGFILLNDPGRIYVGDLFVCELPSLSYGYNFKPEVLRLQRDRNIVSDFDVCWETSKMWSEQPDLPTLLRDNVADVKYASVSAAKADCVYDLFTKEHGKKAVPCSEDSHKILGAKNIIVNEPYRKAIIQSPSFSIPYNKVHKQTPYEILSDWAIRSSFYIDDAFKDIIEQSKRWEVLENADD